MDRSTLLSTIATDICTGCGITAATMDSVLDDIVNNAVLPEDLAGTGSNPVATITVDANLQITSWLDSGYEFTGGDIAKISAQDPSDTGNEALELNADYLALSNNSGDSAGVQLYFWDKYAGNLNSVAYTGGNDTLSFNFTAVAIQGALLLNVPLQDNSGHDSVDTNQRRLYDTDGSTVLARWGGSYCFTVLTTILDNTGGGGSGAPAGKLTIDPTDRELYETDGTTVALKWASGLNAPNLPSGTSSSPPSVNVGDVFIDTAAAFTVAGKTYAPLYIRTA
jgi:hypothetical protein